MSNPITDFIAGFIGKSTEPDTLLSKLGEDLAKKRDEAVTARKESGIEDVWMACEEAYLAIDDTNRSDFTNAKWAKPTGITGGVTAEVSDTKSSSAFIRLTSRYVDMGAAKIADTALPIDDKPFAISATPVPDLVKNQDNDSLALHPTNGGKVMRKATDEEVAAMMPAQQPGQPPAQPPNPTPMVPMTVGEIAKMHIQKAADAAEKAETRIYDWLTEAKFAAEMRKVIHDASRIGVGVLKAPTPVMQKSMAMTKQGNAMVLNIKFKPVPSVKWIDPWNLFPHGSCGEDINNGDGLWERDFISESQLKDFKKDPTYLSDEIDKVLEEGPGKINKGGDNPHDKKNKGRFEIWYYIGQIKRSEMMLSNAIGKDELPDEIDDVHAICSVINDTVIRVIINPMQSGSFNYHAMPWSRRAGHWAGVGVAEQVSTPQRMVNAGTRALLNNGGLSAGIQLIMDPLAIIPADGSPKITPNKLWYRTEDSSYDDVRKAFVAIEFPNVGPQMQSIIQYAFKLAEEACNIPLISQGQTGEQIPTTFGATELQNNNANTLLRNIALILDDHVTCPTVEGFYEWLLLDPEVPDEEKGDFKISVRGSQAMVEKAIQEQTMPAVMNLSLNPAFGLNPKRVAEEFLKGKRLDPRKMQYTEEEQEKMDKQQPPPPVQIAVEQMKGQNAMQLEQAKAQAEMQMSQAEMQQEQVRLANGQATPHMATASAQIERERLRGQTALIVEQSRAHAEAARADKELEIAQQNGQFKLQEMQLQKDLAVLEYTAKHNITLEQAKVQLAQVSMQEQTKRQLAETEQQLAASEGDKNRQVDVHKHTTSLVRDTMSNPNTP